MGKSYAPAIVVTQKSDKSSVLVAVGSTIRAFDAEVGSEIEFSDKTAPASHGNAIRGFTFSEDGKLLASAGDDKLIKMWDTQLWNCFKTLRANKKVSAVSFSSDSKWLFFADKYGVVFAVPTQDTEGKREESLEGEEGKVKKKEEAAQLLGHCCSIITALAISPKNKYIASADRDFKIRISLFPQNPLLGAPNIQSYCLGHTSFVTCVAFIGARSGSQSDGFVVSGSGDGTVRVWDPSSGIQLFCLHLGSAGNDSKMDSSGDEDSPEPPSVSSFAVSQESDILAVAMASAKEIVFVKFRSADQSLFVIQKVSMAGVGPPSSLSFDSSENLWIATGAMEALETDDSYTTPENYAAMEAKARDVSNATYVRIQVMAPSSVPGDCEEGGEEGSKAEKLKYNLLPDNEIPGGSNLLLALQKTLEDVEELVSTASAAADASRRDELSKREFTQEERNFRKSKRNDKK